MIVVIGDVLLDKDIRGVVRRLAPDAPVPVLSDLETGVRLGGAGLAAERIREQGEAVTLITPIANDRDGKRIRSLAERIGISLVALPTRQPTRVKERFSTSEQILFRVDHGDSECSPIAVNESEVNEAVDIADALLVSDYGGGVTSDPTIRSVIERCRTQIPVIWDPHPRGSRPITGLALITPNRMEAGAHDLLVEDRARALCKEWQAPVVVTTGSAGAVLAATFDESQIVPADPVAGDSCGAGDAFAAAVTVALAQNFPLAKAVERAVAAATDWVRREKWQTSAPTVVATGGCFDLLHVGHLATLTAAARFGDRLVVLINSDRSVRGLKGSGRPINDQESRAALIKALSIVDDVVIFDEPTPERALRSLKPDVWVKGGDYQESDLPESRLLKQWGGRTEIVPYLSGYSTTALLEETIDLRSAESRSIQSLEEK